jgi:hypothetical protein
LLERQERRLHPVVDLLVVRHARVQWGLQWLATSNLSPHLPSRRHLL